MVGRFAPQRHERAVVALSIWSGQTLRVKLLEFWPDYGSGPLWTEDGKPVHPRALGLSNLLAERLANWNARYGENRLPIEGDGDAAWLDEGIALLRDVRGELGPEYKVAATEPWWGEAPI